MTLRVGSLCSGYGGLDLGLMAVVGGSVAWHVENDPHPATVLETRFPSVPNYGDLTAVDWSQVERVDWLTAGFPCQPASAAGRRQGMTDERWLWDAVASAVAGVRPRRVLLENVPGLLSVDGGRAFERVVCDLAALGYVGRYGVVRAADAGACHGRARVFILAGDASVCGWDAAQPSQRRREPSGAVGGSSVAVTDTVERGWRGAQGQQRGLGAAERLAAAITDSCYGPGEPQRPWAEPRGRSEVAADTDEPRRQGPEPAGRRLLPARGAAPDTGGERLDGWPRLEGPRGSAPERDETSGDAGNGSTSWGAYEPAIRRWERVVGRPAPRPTEPGRTGERLNPRFVEWMQGLSGGWVTDVLGRGPALKCLGNGVVPQQAALAVRTLLTVGSVAA